MRPREAEPSPGLGASVSPVVAGLGRGMMWRYLQAATTAGASLFTAAFALRRLDPAEYGIFALVLSISGFLGLLDFGLSLTVIRASAVEQASTESVQTTARDDVRAAHAAYFGLGCIALAGVLVLTLFLPGLVPPSASSRAEVRVTVLLVGLSVALFVATSGFSGIVYGRRRFSVIALAATAGAAVNVAAVIMLVGRLHLPSLAIGQLAGVLVNRGWLAIWLARNVFWFRLRPSRPDWTSLRRVFSSALPLFVITIGGQFIATTDLVILGAISTAASVGLYRIGSVVPYQAVSILYQGYDVLFPSLAATSDLKAQTEAARFLSRVAAYLAAVIFGLMIFLRHDIVLLLVGRPAPLAATVLAIFSAVWLVNVTVHALALLLIARGLQRLQAKLVVIEIVVNLFLTLLLVWIFGPVGAAVGSLVAVLLSHWLILPLRVDKELQEPLGTMMLRDALFPVGIGLGVAGLGCAVLAPLSPSVARMVLGGLLGLVIAGAAGAALLGRQGRRRLLSVLRRTTAMTIP